MEKDELEKNDTRVAEGDALAELKDSSEVGPLEPELEPEPEKGNKEVSPPRSRSTRLNQSRSLSLSLRPSPTRERGSALQKVAADGSRGGEMVLRTRLP